MTSPRHGIAVAREHSSSAGRARGGANVPTGSRIVKAQHSARAPRAEAAISASAADPVSFLFTDIERSTRLCEDEPQRMPHALARHVRYGVHSGAVARRDFYRAGALYAASRIAYFMGGVREVERSRRRSACDRNRHRPQESRGRKRFDPRLRCDAIGELDAEAAGRALTYEQALDDVCGWLSSVG